MRIDETVRFLYQIWGDIRTQVRIYRFRRHFAWRGKGGDANAKKKTKERVRSLADG